VVLAGRMAAAEGDAAGLGGQVEDDPAAAHRALRILEDPEIAVAAARHDDGRRIDAARLDELLDDEGADESGAPCEQDLLAAEQPRHAGCLPVYPGRPALTILRVPLDRFPHALFARELGRPAGQLVELAEVHPELFHFALPEPGTPLGVGLELFLAPVPELLAGSHDQVVPVEDRDGLAVAVHVDVAGQPEERRVDVTADAVLHEAEV